MAVNNPLGIQQNDGELLIGSTESPPIAVTITGSDDIGVIIGPGSIKLNASLHTNWSVQEVLSASSILMVPFTHYTVGNTTTPFVSTFTLPPDAVVGDQFRLSTYPPNGVMTLFAGATAPVRLITYQSFNNLTQAVSVAGQPGFIWLMYIGIIGGNQMFQVLDIKNIVLG